MLNHYSNQMTAFGHNGNQEAFLSYLVERETARQEAYITTREYYDGVQNTQLTDRQRQYLNLPNGADFAANYCPMVVNAKSDRLKVTAFNTSDGQKDVLNKWWRRNRMDGKQGIVHHTAIRDGDSFVLVEWDDKSKLPRFHFEPAYAGDGVMVYYSDERRDEIEFASKHWRIEHGINAGTMRRLNLYFPDRVEKYVSHDAVATGNWQPYLPDGDTIGVLMPGKIGMAGVYWWTVNGTESGEPLGIPIVHFKHNDTGDQFGTSHLANVMPLQDAVNKAMIDLLAVMDTNAFSILAGYGTDAWANLPVGPGAIAAVNKPYSEARLERIPADSPDGMLAAYNALVMEIGRVSGTPLSYFQQSGQVAAASTLKMQEIALISQLEKAQTDFGNSWEDVLNIARRLENAFGAGGMDEDEIIDCVWTEAVTRNDKEQAETLAIRVEKLGVTETQAQVEMGYDAEEIATMAREKLRKQAMAIVPYVPPAEDTQATDDTLTQTESADSEQPEAAA